MNETTREIAEAINSLNGAFTLFVKGSVQVKLVTGDVTQTWILDQDEFADLVKWVNS